MRAFNEMSGSLQTLLLSLLFLLNLCQYGYLLLLFHYGDKRRGYMYMPLMLLVFISLPVLARSMYDSDMLWGQLSGTAIGLIWLILSGCTIGGIRQQIREGHQRLMPQSVKEAADKLTGGLVFFSENGLIVLCNTKMQELFLQMTGHDLQMQGELEEALKRSFLAWGKSAQGLSVQEQMVREHSLIRQSSQRQPAAKSLEEDVSIARLPDGSVWKFERTEVHIAPHQIYTQYIASDVTQLYELRETIARDNEKMQEMIRQIHSITKNVAEITRQEEILTAKMRVHNKMGNCMLAIRQYLLSDQKHDPEEKQQLVRLWEENLKELQGEVGACDTPDAYEMVMRIAADLGLEVVLHGSMPENQKTAYLLVTALRECVTNALNHADARRLDMTISMTGSDVMAAFTNDGTKPEGEIREGGGLSSLRSKIEASGGTMEVTGEPVFMVQVKLPAEG